nr:hypothetical protein [Natrinema marinum]
MGLDPRLMSALLWGLVGVLSVLVLVFGYALALEPIVSIPGTIAIALAVGSSVSIGAYALEPRLAAWAADRTTE